MTQYQEFFSNLKNCNSYTERAGLLEVMLMSFKRGKSASKADLNEIKSFVFDEISNLSDLISAAPNYKAKDEIFYYEDKLMGLFMFICAKNAAVSDDEFNRVKDVITTVEKYRVLETAIDEMFKLDKITIEDAKKVIEIANPLTDEYQKGLFFQGLLNYEKDINRFTAEGKAEIANYIDSELERHLSKKGELTEDEINSLEIASDVCKNFLGNKTILLLNRILSLPNNNIRYYAAATLISCKQPVPANVIAELAKDLVYANLTYNLLKTHNLTNMFPKEYSAPEYLAKSDLVHWLTYPTELGKMPDEIVLLGDVKVKKEQYYIFKYKSDSKTLSDDLHNVWLIGWSSNDGGTFSNFDRLCDYEQKKPEKTLKVIKKKLIG